MRYLTLSALAVGLVYAASSASRASDTIRLGGPSAEAAIQGATDTELVRHGGGWGRGGWGHGGWGHGGWGRGYYGGGWYGRGYYGGYYGRGYYGGGYYGGGYGGYYGSPYYYGSYYSPYYGNSYYSSPFYYGSSYYGCANTSPAPVMTLQAYSSPQVQNGPQRAYSELLMPPANGSNGTYPYNGGPANPVPLPGNNVAPMNNAPRGIVPLDGKLVSMPREITGGVTPIVVPNAGRSTFVSTTSAPATQQLNPTPTRIVYPAYGEEPILPAPRRNVNR